jgi:hypothetical protein
MLLFGNRLFAQDTTASSEKKPFRPKYYIQMGAFRPVVSTSLQINGERGPGVIVSLEDNLGFSERPWVFRAEGTANFTKRSGVALTYVKLNRKQDWSVDRDFTIFDTTFSVGAKLGIYFNTTFIAASYKYTIFSKPTWDAGLAVGIRFMQVKVGVDLETQNTSDYAESVTVPAPVPVLGVFGTAYLNDRLRMRYNFDYFTISVQGTRGGVLDNRFALEYYFIKNLGLGAAVNFLSYQVKEIPLEENFDGQIKYSLNGFSFYLTTRF